MIKLSLKIFLIGLLINPVLINIIGFISPFWAIFVLKDDMRSLELLRIFQPYAPLISIIFSLSLFKLSQIEDRKWIKALCLLTAIIYIASSIYGFFPKDNVMYSLLVTIYYFMELGVLVLAALILLNKSDLLDKCLVTSNVKKRIK